MKDIHLKDIKKDQVFFERGYGETMEFIALEDARLVGLMDEKYKQWGMKGKYVNSEEIVDFLVTENHEHYGPKLFVKSNIPVDKSIPQYSVTKISIRNKEDKFDETNKYVLTGTLYKVPEVADILFVIDNEGMIFRSSRITWVDFWGKDDYCVSTKNSRYKIEKVK